MASRLREALREFQERADRSEARLAGTEPAQRSARGRHDGGEPTAGGPGAGPGSTGPDRGRGAERPSDIPTAGWRDIALRVKDEVRTDRVPLVAAGVAFYAMLALFPSLVAFVSVYGLVADPEQVTQQMEQAAEALPQEAASLIEEQLQSIVQAGDAALTTGFAVSLAAVLWTASSGVHGLMQALTVAYDESEDRGFVKRRAVALALTLFAMVVGLVVLGGVVLVPLVLGAVGLGAAGEWALRILRWPLLGVAVVAALAVIYRYAPDRDRPQWRWVSWGAVLATVLWVVGTLAFTFYVSNFGSYQETYGALGAVIILLLWLFVSAFVVVLGAEVDAEMEHQTAHDTTVGERQPMGQREARVADELGSAQ